MKKIILTTTIILLLVSCTVTKQTKSDNNLAQQDSEINKPINSPTGQVTQIEVQESKTEKATVSAVTTEVNERSNYNTPDKKAILEKIRTELIPQTKDYNPYQYAREKYVISSLEVKQENESDDCEAVKGIIKEFYEIASTASEEEKCKYITYISLFQCKETYDFLVDQIKNSFSEAVRCDAINALAWSLSSDYLPYILEYAKKDSLSVQEKLALAKAFSTFGIYTSYSDLKKEAIKLLDEICYHSSSYSNLEYDCAWTYYKLGGEAAIDYYILLLNRREGFRRVATAVMIAELGEYETTYPMFVENIHSEVTNNVLESIDGLRIIGTEEALRLIEEQAQNKNEKVAKKAQETLRKLNKKGGEK